MIASHDDSEITYYDELGVAPNASPEQIRDAFRLFVRLLHPDQQTDPQLKDIAEKQMRKLNRIYDVLSDPESRRRYDEILETDFSPPIILNAPSPGGRRLGATLAWGAAIVVSAGLLIWLASENTSGVPGRALDSSCSGSSSRLFAYVRGGSGVRASAGIPIAFGLENGHRGTRRRDSGIEQAARRSR